ncbi:MAG: DUF2029 domain-containing protein, partial [bacterium]|nr:DUF2029 domain-containing protein [bacterium]
MIRLTTNLVEPGVAEGAAGDFRDASYFPAQALLDGVNPYDPGAYLGFDSRIGQYFPLYGPHHLLLHLPFTALSLDAAIAAYAVITLLLTLTLAWVSLGLAGIDRPAPVVFGTTALLLASNAGRANFVDLQPTIIIVLGAYLAISHRDHPWLAAVGVALTFLKPQFGIPLVIILFLTGRAGAAWRGMLLAAAASAPVVARLIDIEDGIGGVFDAVGDNLQFATQEGPSFLQVDLTGSFGVASITAALVVAALVLAAAVLVLRSKPGLTSKTGLTITVAAVLLVLFHVNYDLLALTWPLLAVAAAVWNGTRDRPTVALLVLLLALLFNPLTSSFAIQTVGPADLLGAVSAILLLAVFGLAMM